jgi:formiminotetrahydrofolate cyclodeaminase
MKTWNMEEIIERNQKLLRRRSYRLARDQWVWKNIIETYAKVPKLRQKAKNERQTEIFEFIG